MIVLYTTERDYPWGTLRSTHASKTKVVLEEKRIPYRIENLPPGHLWKKPPEMVARHPLGKVPYIEDGGLTIYDSTVIDEYLEERYSWPRLMPGDAIGRAKIRMIEQFADEALLVGNLPPIWMPYGANPISATWSGWRKAAKDCDRAIFRISKNYLRRCPPAAICAAISRSPM
jgi:glutathione S-transferase